MQAADGSVRANFTGGSLIVGGVGRTDLLGPPRTPELTRAPYATVLRLRELPDDITVLPTHGAGSFCVAGTTEGRPTSTIGALRMWNPAFGAGWLAELERILEDGRTRCPTYYRHMGPGYRRGRRELGGPPDVAALSVDKVAGARLAGAWIVDARPRARFARLHVVGSLNVDLEESFAAYVGWLVLFDAPFVLVVDHPEEAAESAVELLRIGYDRVLGFLRGGAEAWAEDGRPTSSYVTLTRTPWRRSSGVGRAAHPGRAAAVGMGGGGRARIASAVRGGRARRAGVVARRGRAVDRDVQGRRPRRDRREPLDAAGIPVRLVARGGVPSLPAATLERPGSPVGDRPVA